MQITPVNTYNNQVLMLTEAYDLRIKKIQIQLKLFNIKITIEQYNGKFYIYDFDPKDEERGIVIHIFWKQHLLSEFYREVDDYHEEQADSFDDYNEYPDYDDMYSDSDWEDI